MSAAARAAKASGYRSKSAALKTIRRDAGEKKGVDILLTQDPVLATTNTNGGAFTLNLIASGNGSFNRVGRKVFLKSVFLRAVISFEHAGLATTSNVLGNELRAVVVYDKQPSGTLPTFDDIMGHTLQDGTEACLFNDPPRYDNMSRFQVLSDEYIPMKIEAVQNAGGTEDTVTDVYHLEKYIKLGNRETIFSGQSATCTIADISSGGLYVYFRCWYADPDQSEINVSSASIARLRYSE